MLSARSKAIVCSVTDGRLTQGAVWWAAKILARDSILVEESSPGSQKSVLLAVRSRELQCFLLFHCRQCLTVEPWLAWSSPYRPAGPCLPSVHYHSQPRLAFKAGSRCVAQAGLRLASLLVLPQMLGLQACAPSPGSHSSQSSQPSPYICVLTAACLWSMRSPAQSTVMTPALGLSCLFSSSI